MKLMWLSFADEVRFRGVVIIEAENVALAALRCSMMGINPGGEVAGFEIPDDLPDFADYVANKERLLQAEEVKRKFGALSVHEWDRREGELPS